MAFTKYCILLFFLIVSGLCCGGSGSAAVNEYGLKHWPQAKHMADFILSLQGPDGAIEDNESSNSVNTDSNMEYALISLAAIYKATNETKYLTALRKGIQWLADEEEIIDPEWKGSWWYGYNADGNHIEISPGMGYVDARGVDTTSALFVYCLYLEKRVNPSSTLPQVYKTNAVMALEYLRQKITDTDGLTWSSYIQKISGEWELYKYKYTADQSDVYLGYKAAALLYDSSEYVKYAELIKTKVESKLFSGTYGRYSLGMEEDGILDFEVSNFDPVQCQGQCPWAWGISSANTASAKWLLSKVQSDGSVKVCGGDPLYSLSAGVLGLSRIGLRQNAPGKTFEWLTSSNIFNSDTGGLFDAEDSGYHDEYCNNAGLCIVALLGFTAFEE